MTKTFTLFTSLIILLACNQNPKTTMENVKAFEIENLDTTIDPCQNFFTYSGGTWMKSNPVPETESRWGSFNILAKELDKKLENLVLNSTIKDNLTKGSPDQQIKDFFLSLNDSSAQAQKANRDEIKALLNRIDQISLETFEEDLAFLFKNGISNPYGFYIGQDDKNSELNAIHFSQSGQSLPDKSFYSDERHAKIREGFVSYINKISQDKDLPLNNKGQNILTFESKIAEISKPKQSLRIQEENYHKMSIDDFNKMLFFDISQTIKALGLNDAKEVIVGQPEFFQNLNQVIKDNFEDFKEYLRFKTFNKYAGYISKEWEEESFNFYGKLLSGQKKMKPEIERQVKRVNANLGWPLGQIFIKEHFSEDSKKYMVEMIENIRSAYAKSINSLTWMGDTTKQKALEKLKKFTYKIGYPDEWKDYSSVDINPQSIIKNLRNIDAFEFQYMINKFGKPVNRKEWYMTPQTVNAYYSSSNNEIVFPAGILQPPFFHISFDDPINYGGIGGVIAHEFTHGFDDQGSKFDGDGNYNNWWTEADRSRFNALAQKLINQYNSYSPIEDMHVNGQLTLGENIADQGGVNLAFAALEEKLSDQNFKPIDGMTWQQRFFLGWAQVWRSNITDAELKKRLLQDYHSPAEYRVVGPLANSVPFFMAFGCQKDSADVIKIW